MNDEVLVHGLIVALLMFTGAMFGYGFGKGVGQETACQSIKMEWVKDKDKDKCMKVTREEVK